MSLKYGVLAGKVDVFKREDDQDTPHLQIRVIDRNNQAWRVPVNVLSGDQSLLIFHRVDPLQGHPILASLSDLEPGFIPLPSNSASVSRALDFFRSPLFDWPTGVEVLPSGPGENDDLQDSLITDLKSLKSQNGDIFVFGAKFPEQGQPFNPRPIDQEFGTKQGIHDIHMNQGNPPGRFERDNGIFQDGGLILKFSNRYVGLFLRFQTQWLPTDDRTGNRIPNKSRPIPAGSNIPSDPDGNVTPSNVSNPNIYVERALVNPVGSDPGKEVVVIGNASSEDVDLTGWSIVDRNNLAETLSGVLRSGESLRIVLSGNTAQLGNKGGTIRLKDASGNQVHAVSYSKEDGSTEGRYVRFIT
ncbi:DUF2278 family protein [Nostoc sp. NMS4]|uniref:DUF2278 family protein n=1 Tax=Nostoc sp. NMS4 TaxID=2815390 RepID=UPI0025F8900F|nr:DUF2278 family protein [Nostoc sp. NMS4]MBN3926023.1 DUF2278 family protein [Nostoc sp. NMS4]